MSQSYEAKGQIKFIGETEQVTDKFKKRIVVLELPDELDEPDRLPFGLRQDTMEPAVLDLTGRDQHLLIDHHDVSEPALCAEWGEPRQRL